MWKQKRAKAQANRIQAMRNRLNTMRKNKNAAKKALNNHNKNRNDRRSRREYVPVYNAYRAQLMQTYLALSRSVHLLEKNIAQLDGINRRQRN